LGETYVNTPFMKKVLHITKRKRETDIQHYYKSDDVWTGFKVANHRLKTPMSCRLMALRRLFNTNGGKHEKT